MFKYFFGEPPTRVLSEEEGAKLNAPKKAAEALELNIFGTELILPAILTTSHAASMASLSAFMGVSTKAAKSTREAAQEANKEVKKMATGMNDKYTSAANMFSAKMSNNAADKLMKSLRYDYTPEQIKDKRSAAAILKAIGVITAESEEATRLTIEAEAAVVEQYRGSAELYIVVAERWMRIAEGVANILRSTVKNPELVAEADRIILKAANKMEEARQLAAADTAEAADAAKANFMGRQAASEEKYRILSKAANASDALYRKAAEEARKRALIQQERDKEAGKERVLTVYIQDLINYSGYTKEQADTVEIAERYMRTTHPPPDTKTPTVDWYVSWLKTARRSLVHKYKYNSHGYYYVIGQYVDKYPEDVFDAWIRHMKDERFFDPREFAMQMELRGDVERQAKTFLDGLLHRRYGSDANDAVRMVPYEAAKIVTSGLDVEQEMRQRREAAAVRRAEAGYGGGTRKRRSKKTRRHRAKVLSRKE